MNALYDITPFTLLDFPDTPAAIFWFAGCNLRCHYCYNPEILFSPAKISQEEALKFLQKRQGLLEGVVLSGGEATLYPHLETFAKKIKAMGFALKLDTNATRPDVIRKLLDASLIDYIALDYKAPQNKITSICNTTTQESFFWQSFAIIKESAIAFEVRTTYHSHLLNKEELLSMYRKLQDAGYQKEFYVQLVQTHGATLGNIENESMQNFQWIEEFATLRI